MKNKTLFATSFYLLSLLFSCGNHQGEQHLLDSIEQVWQLSEASLSEALTRAEGLRDSVSGASEYIRQKYDLLSIRLRDKRYIIPASPDSAQQTVSFFESHGSDVDKERAYYYLSSAYRDLKDYPRAVTYSLKAIETAKQCKRADTIIWQNSLSKLNHLYMLQLNYEAELEAALQAVELARQSGKNLECYLMDAASAYKHQHDTLHCLQYCDQAYQLIKQEGFPAKYGSILAYQLTLYSEYNHYEKVDTLLQHLSQLPNELRPRNYELGLAMFHENANHTDSAIRHYQTYYDNEKTLSGRYEASAGLQRCYLQRGDSGQAALWGCRLYETNDSIIDQRAFEETQRARDTYVYYRNMEQEQSILRRDERIIFASLITGLTLLSIVLGLMTSHYFRKKKFMEEIIGKDRLLQERAKELMERKKMNRELTQMALMSNAADNAKEVVAHFRKVAAGRARLEEESWKELMGAVETLYPGFLGAVQERLQGHLHEPLFRTICLLKVGLAPIQIAQIMDAKKQTVWNRIKRANAICGDLLAAS